MNIPNANETTPAGLKTGLNFTIPLDQYSGFTIITTLSSIIKAPKNAIRYTGFSFST